MVLPTENQTWICKPTASNQGKGIFLLRNQEEVAALQVKTQSIEDDPIYRKMPFRAPQARVVQRCWARAPQRASVRVALTPGPAGAWERGLGNGKLRCPQLGLCVASRSGGVTCRPG